MDILVGNDGSRRRGVEQGGLLSAEGKNPDGGKLFETEFGVISGLRTPRECGEDEGKYEESEYAGLTWMHEVPNLIGRLEGRLEFAGEAGRSREFNPRSE